ncbi:MAG: hypothetical protein HZB29_02795 [Nitrospinae bacterium]|nr:hypothetical protein [Nitrospinota bacterium]
MKAHNRNDGLSAILAIFMIVALAAMGTAALHFVSAGQSSAVDVLRTESDFYAAQSGLEWARQVTAAYTTADRARFQALDGTFMDIATPGGPRFTLGIAYSDTDNDPDTADTVTVTSASATRSVTITMTVPPPSTAAYLSDQADQGDATAFDNTYTAGTPSVAHGGMSPFASVTNQPGGDTSGVMTLQSEPGGLAGILRMGGVNEARFTIYTGSCFKWPSVSTGDPCGYAACATSGVCNARQGLNIAPDGGGYQNYFLKIRFRLVSGTGGFGVYFRASYPNQTDPYAVDFAGLTGYIWQYDPYLGYISPCSTSTAVFGNDSAGMLFTRRINLGSETCGAGCELFTAPSGGEYPFFCPENRTGQPQLDGWMWNNTNWTTQWRTVYIYVYQNIAAIYLGRQEITGAGSETQPVLVGSAVLDSISALLKTGDIGVRTWGGSVVDIDYIQVFPNDLNYNPSTFAG